MRFTKMHGLGNDFVVLEQHDGVPPELVRRLCDRRFGIGADGVLTVSRTEDEILMGYWNADGSAAEMCGNGLRCVGRYAFDHNWVSTSSFVVMTPSGPRQVAVHGDGQVTAQIGTPVLQAAEQWGAVEAVPVTVGNPHGVVYVDDVELAPVARAGAELEARHNANIEFVETVSDSLIKVRTWERGVGETLACGSGAVAAAAVAHALHDAPSSLGVQLRGGRLTVDVGANPATITGPAEYVFSGTLTGS